MSTNSTTLSSAFTLIYFFFSFHTLHLTLLLFFAGFFNFCSSTSTTTSLCYNSLGITFTSRDTFFFLLQPEQSPFVYHFRPKSKSPSFYLFFVLGVCYTTLSDHRNLVRFFLQSFFSLFHTLHVYQTDKFIFILQLQALKKTLKRKKTVDLM